MSLFKRFEVWMLLVFVLAGVGFVLFTQQASERADTDDPEVAVIDKPQGDPEADPPTPIDVAPTPAPGAFAIEDVSLKPSGAENWLLELQVRYHNGSNADLELTSPNVQLLTDAGDEVPNFFLAFAPPPVATAGAEELVQLRYWLDAPHRGEDLELKILDERVEVALEKADDGSVVRDRDDQGDSSGS